MGAGPIQPRKDRIFTIYEYERWGISKDSTNFRRNQDCKWGPSYSRFEFGLIRIVTCISLDKIIRNNRKSRFFF